jgi:predicted naringenin-chalcone synthase
MTAYLNRIATAVPPYDVHAAFIRCARAQLPDRHSRAVFERLVDKSQIAHRFSVLSPADHPEAESIDAGRFYASGKYPTTGARMQAFEAHAPGLAAQAVAGLELGSEARRITHLITTSCTGFYAPGLDLDLVDRCGLPTSVERTMIGFMGCYAAINALKLARHVVQSEPGARVLIVNLELCSLHLQETRDLETMLSFLVFGDGCAASIVTSEPTGLAIDRFHALLVPDTRDLLSWKVRDAGFDMVLSGRVPGAIERGLESGAGAILDGARPSEIDVWAVHPGGRSVLDAVEHGLGLGPSALAPSRRVLMSYGNMSSATIMFVLQAILATTNPGDRGCAMSFGPGLVAETMLFRGASREHA